MQASGWGLTFMAAIIVAGAVVCRFRNDGAHSGRAAALSRASRVSFATLALIALAFAGTVLMGQQLWAAPMFAVGSIVVPLAVYLAMDPRPRSAKPPARSGSRPREAGRCDRACFFFRAAERRSSQVLARVLQDAPHDRRRTARSSR